MDWWGFSMRSQKQIRADMDRELRRLAQAYLYGTPAEIEQRRRVVARLAAEQRRIAPTRQVQPVTLVAFV